MQNTITQTATRRPDRKQLILASLLGLAAAVLIVVFLNNADSGKSTTSDDVKVPVFVATEPILVGTKVSENQFELKQLSAAAVVPDAIKDKSQVVGQTARYPIAPGTQIGASSLVQAQKSQLLSYQIPAGFRGMTIPVSDKETPAKLLAPGDFVDVLVTIKVESLGRPSANGNSSEFKGAATILQNIQVLTVDKSYVDKGIPYDASIRGDAPKDKDDVAYVTLAVKPDDAQMLWLAQNQGKVTLALRPFGEGNTTPLRPTLEPFFFGN
jgi:pilus assembly protein CpaB